MHFGKPYPLNYRRFADAKTILKKAPADKQVYGARVLGRMLAADNCQYPVDVVVQSYTVGENTAKSRANTFAILAVNGTLDPPGWILTRRSPAEDV